jgi:LDH2 family malate/lactate/ureidoglycolate dehydrogenase
MKVMPEKLKKIAIDILKGLHASDEEATIAAEMMVQSDMRGIDTHGVYFLKLVAERVDAHMVNIPTPLKVVSESETTTLFDGGNGLGQVAAFRAMKTSIQKARKSGTGLSLIRNTNNIGCLACYTTMAAKEGTVGIAMTNGAASVSPWGGAEAFFGTNPISMGVPVGSQPPIVLDMANTVVARGKIRRAQRMKESIPLGWALDAHGVPTTDPSAAMKGGTLVPVGGPKGYGLVLMVDILAGMLSGSSYGPALKTFHQLEGPTGVGAFLMAIDIEKFMPLSQFGSLIQEYIKTMKGVKKAKDVSRIYLPGEIEHEKEKQSMAEGVEMTSLVVSDLNQLLEKVKSPLRLS